MPKKSKLFLHNDMKKMARLWSDDLVVTNPLNKFVNELQVLGMVEIRLTVDHRL